LAIRLKQETHRSPRAAISRLLWTDYCAVVAVLAIIGFAVFQNLL